MENTLGNMFVDIPEPAEVANALGAAAAKIIERVDVLTGLAIIPENAITDTVRFR